MWRSKDGKIIADFVPVVKKKKANGKKRLFFRPMFKGRVRAVRIGEERLHD